MESVIQKFVKFHLEDRISAKIVDVFDILDEEKTNLT